ncbi:polyphenol oxidase family protein [Hydrogenobaculum acidophilum]
MLFYGAFKDFKIGITKEEKEEGVFLPKQIHSNLVVYVDSHDKKVEADGIITNKTGFKIGIKTADCVPILLKSRNYVGAIHAGWRGLYNGILKEAFSLFDSFLEKPYFAFIGPSAKECCYEVGQEFQNYFKSLKTINDKLFFDTQKEAISQLKSLNPSIELLIYDTCTICNKEIPSYRRDKTKERIVVFIEKV